MAQGRLPEAEAITQGVLQLPHLTLIMRLPALTVPGRTCARLGKPRSSANWTRPGRTGAIRYLRRHLWDRGELALWQYRAGLPPPDLDAAALPPPTAAELAGDGLAASAQWRALGLAFEAGLALLGEQGEGAGPAALRALALFEGPGARPAAARARSLASELGNGDSLPKLRRGPCQAARSHPDGLTRREAQILDLLLAGQSNADIARRLVRSPAHGRPCWTNWARTTARSSCAACSKKNR